MKSNWMTTTINDVCSLVTDGRTVGAGQITEILD